ncbi:hypothetical protein WDZ92_08665 [Nostoc sp. NIES-2111]
MTEERKQYYILELQKTIFLGTEQQSVVSDILKRTETDTDLTDDERLALETFVRTMPMSPNMAEIKIPTETVEATETRTPARQRFLPKYNFEESIDIPDGLKEYSFDESCENVTQKYAEWLLERYLPVFHPMPNKEIQYPIGVCMMLLNCNAVLSAKQAIPHLYCLGRNGSGKSEFTKSICQHYPRNLWIEIRPGNTGASVRDSLDLCFGYGEAGVAMFDNFHPRMSLQKLDAHYDIILANNRESAISRISGQSRDDGKSEYRTYCYKLFSSIFDPNLYSEEMGEISRRLLVLKFQTASPEDTRYIYDWEGMQRIFQRIWGDENIDNVHNTYAKILAKIARIKPKDIPDILGGKMWSIYQVPIAVGVFCGVFQSIQHGIEHFVKYVQWVNGDTKGAVGSALSIVLSRYIKEEMPKLQKEAENPYSAMFGKFDSSKLTQKELCDYLQQSTGYAVSKRELDELITLMSNFGYNYQRMEGGYGFMKDTPTP